jgi:molybdenum cofactor cytidylyltransferase
LVSSQLLNQLVAKYIATECTIVASEYDNSKGVPALFDEFHFDALRNLEESEGARTLIKQHADQVQTVSFTGGIFDVDTQTDYRQLLAMGVEMNDGAVAAN